MTTATYRRKCEECGALIVFSYQIKKSQKCSICGKQNNFGKEEPVRTDWDD